MNHFNVHRKIGLLGWEREEGFFIKYKFEPNVLQYLYFRLTYLLRCRHDLDWSKQMQPLENLYISWPIRVDIYDSSTLLWNFPCWTERLLNFHELCIHQKCHLSSWPQPNLVACNQWLCRDCSKPKRPNWEPKKPNL